MSNSFFKSSNFSTLGLGFFCNINNNCELGLYSIEKSCRSSLGPGFGPPLSIPSRAEEVIKEIRIREKRKIGPFLVQPSELYEAIAFARGGERLESGNPSGASVGARWVAYREASESAFAPCVTRVV